MEQMTDKIRIYAKDAVAVTGNVVLRENGEKFLENFSLGGAEGGAFLDFSEPVIDTSNYLSSIAPGKDSATWQFTIPTDGKYRLTFRYNNPGFKMGGERNQRDERNCRVILDVGENLLSEENWLGWMIFNVSGTCEGVPPEALQTKKNIAGNQRWNLNFMNCYLQAGEHTLTLALEAPPGQAVYDGPNIDWFEVEFINEKQDTNELPQITANFNFNHPGIYLTQEKLMTIKENLREKKEVTIRGLEEIKRNPLSLLNYQPHSITRIDVGPYNQPNIGGEEWSKDCLAAHYHALLWALEGDERHAKKTIEIIEQWSNSLKEVADGNDLKLRFSLLGIELIAAAEIIAHLYNRDPAVSKENHWSDEGQKKFAEFLQSKILSKTSEFYPQANGNWDAIIGAFNMAAAVYLEDDKLFKRCLRQFAFGDVVGGPCLSMGSLFNYIYESGESQESNRDQVHARMGLTGLANQAYIASLQGIDLFSIYNERLLKGFQYNASYQIGQIVSSRTFISDRGRGTKDISSLGYEIMIEHYQSRPEELSEIKKAAELTLRSATKNELGDYTAYWGALLLANQ